MYVALGSDFSFDLETVTFPTGAGPQDTQAVLVNIIDDDIEENTEDIQVIASVMGSIGMFTTGRDSALITIIDDDGKY